MATVTLLQARNRVREKADVVNATDRHPNTELNGYINRSRRKLLAKLATLQLLKVQKSHIVTGSGAYSYTLPDDYFATYGVFQEYGNGTHRPLGLHTGGDRPFGRPGVQGDPVSYATAEVEDDVLIEFNPQPTSGTFIIQYVPEPGDMAADTDTFEFPMNWGDFVVYDAAIMVLEKDDLPFTQLAVRKQEIEVEIDQAAIGRDLLGSAHIRDVRGTRFTDPADSFSYNAFGRRGRWRR